MAIILDGSSLTIESCEHSAKWEKWSSAGRLERIGMRSMLEEKIRAREIMYGSIPASRIF